MEVKRSNRNEPHRFLFVRGDKSIVYTFTAFRAVEPDSDVLDVPDICKSGLIQDYN